MNTIRRSAERGHANHGWLDTYHTFSFASYHDPRHMGFRSLRVINEDVVQPGQGFGTHPHRDMEILTYVLSGALQHRDSLGTGSVIRPGDVQRMSAGTGVTHSEFNASETEPVHLLQIWLLPAERGIAPSYEQKAFADDEKAGRLRLIASQDAREGSVLIHTDASVYAGVFAEGQTAEHPLAQGAQGAQGDQARHAWVHVARGEVEVNGHRLSAGDAIALSQEESVRLRGVSSGEVLVFDLA
jgi:redox-sensitive bicupin YhaK (pirin superfamily)